MFGKKQDNHNPDPEETQSFSLMPENTQSQQPEDLAPIESKSKAAHPLNDAGSGRSNEIGQRPTAPAPIAPSGDSPTPLLPLYEENEEKKRGKFLAVLGALFLALAVGAGVFFWQENRMDSSRASAMKEGQLKAQYETEANYKKGGAGYNKIFQAGQQAGKSEGQNSGKEEGIKQGRSNLIDELAQTSQAEFDPAPAGKAPKGNPAVVREASDVALGGFADWSTSSLYSIRVADGPGLIPFQVIARTKLQPNKFYRVCEKKSGQLCEVEIPQKSGVPGIPENDSEDTEPTTPSSPIEPDLPPDPTDPSTRP